MLEKEQRIAQLSMFESWGWFLTSNEEDNAGLLWFQAKASVCGSCQPFARTGGCSQTWLATSN